MQLAGSPQDVTKVIRPPGRNPLDQLLGLVPGRSVALQKQMTNHRTPYVGESRAHAGFAVTERNNLPPSGLDPLTDRGAKLRRIGSDRLLHISTYTRPEAPLLVRSALGRFNETAQRDICEEGFDLP
jgi:hypothetical protein